MMEGCRSCSEAVCYDCMSEYYRSESGICKKCSTAMSHCIECSDMNTCTKCQADISLLNNREGVCQCNEAKGWTDLSQGNN